MNDDSLRSRRTRQRFTVLVLATVLIVGGLVVLFALQRLPLPMRIFAGLGDIVAGCVLLVLVRQKFRRDR
jgi:cyanate permease